MKGRIAFFIVVMVFAAALSFQGKLWHRPSLFRSLMMSTLTQQVNEKKIASHHAYTKLEEFVVQEYGLKGVLYEHNKSGAQVHECF
jgi:hypothetical protein